MPLETIRWNDCPLCASFRARQVNLCSDVPVMNKIELLICVFLPMLSGSGWTRYSRAQKHFPTLLLLGRCWKQLFHINEEVTASRAFEMRKSHFLAIALLDVLPILEERRKVTHASSKRFIIQ